MLSAEISAQIQLPHAELQRETGLVWDCLHSIAEAAFTMLNAGLHDEAAGLATCLAKTAQETLFYFMWLRDRWSVVKRPDSVLPDRLRGENGKMILAVSEMRCKRTLPTFQNWQRHLLLTAWTIAKNLSLPRQGALQTNLVIGDKLSNVLTACGDGWLLNHVERELRFFHESSAICYPDDEIVLDPEDVQRAVEISMDPWNRLAFEQWPLRRGLERAISAIATSTSALAQLVAGEMKLLETALESDMPRVNLSLLMLAPTKNWQAYPNIVEKALALLKLETCPVNAEGYLVQSVVKARQLEAYMLRRAGLNWTHKRQLDASVYFGHARSVVILTTPDDATLLLATALLDRLQPFLDVDLPNTDELLAGVIARAVEISSHRRGKWPLNGLSLLKKAGFSESRASEVHGVLVRNLPQCAEALKSDYVAGKEAVLMRDWLTTAHLVF